MSELAQMTKQFNMMKRMRDMERKEKEELKAWKKDHQGKKELKKGGHEAYIRNITTIKKLKEANEEIEKLKKENQELFEELEYMKKENKNFKGYMMDD